MVKREQIQFAVLSHSQQIYEASQLLRYRNEPLLRFHIIYKRGVPFLDVQTLGNILYCDFQYELIRFLNQVGTLVINRSALKDILI